MAGHRPIRLPKPWSKHVKAGVLHANSLMSIVLNHARGRAGGRRRLHAELGQATSEMALLREELSIKDGVVCHYWIAPNSPNFSEVIVEQAAA